MFSSVQSDIMSKYKSQSADIRITFDVIKMLLTYFNKNNPKCITYNPINHVYLCILQLTQNVDHVMTVIARDIKQ